VNRRKLHPDIPKALTEGMEEGLEIAVLIKELQQKLQRRFGGDWNAFADFDAQLVAVSRIFGSDTSH